jgi:hypothetical protein
MIHHNYQSFRSNHQYQCHNPSFLFLLSYTMKFKTILVAALFLLTACKSQTATPTLTPTLSPNETPAATATLAPTETLLPTETASPVPTPSDIFGAIPLNSVQAFSIEPVAKAIFDRTVQGYIDSGAIQELRVDSVAVFPAGDGGLIAEIVYSLRTTNDPWPDDFGRTGSDGWITGKCSRFDLVATETEHQLRNKRLCS